MVSSDDEVVTEFSEVSQEKRKRRLSQYGTANFPCLQSKARYNLIGRVKNQDIFIDSLGIKKKSRRFIFDFPLQVKNQEF